MAATFHAILRRLAAVPPAYFVFAALVLVLWFTRPQLFNHIARAGAKRILEHEGMSGMIAFAIPEL